MRIVRFNTANKTQYGIIQENTVYTLTEDPFRSFNSGRDPIMTGENYPLEKVKLLSPCLPSKIVCLGVNYRPHAQEMNSNLPSAPLIFLKPPTSLIGPEDAIVLPRNWKRVDFEGELGVVIGRQTKYISETEVKKHILGYTCFNDVTERHYQKEDGQWTRGKGFDTFAPCGPWMETEIDPNDLKLETLLNGKVRQTARTSELIFGINKIVSFVSGVMTLLPGDIIATGTPAGVGAMQAGDIVEIRIEKIGTLRNTVAVPV